MCEKKKREVALRNWHNKHPRGTRRRKRKGREDEGSIRFSFCQRKEAPNLGVGNQVWANVMKRGEGKREKEKN